MPSDLPPLGSGFVSVDRGAPRTYAVGFGIQPRQGIESGIAMEMAEHRDLLDRYFEARANSTELNLTDTARLALAELRAAERAQGISRQFTELEMAEQRATNQRVAAQLVELMQRPRPTHDCSAYEACQPSCPAYPWMQPPVPTRSAWEHLLDSD